MHNDAENNTIALVDKKDIEELWGVWLHCAQSLAQWKVVSLRISEAGC